MRLRRALAVAVAGGLGGLALATGLATVAYAAPYGPWQGTVTLTGPAGGPQSNYPGATLSATYTLGARQPDGVTYSASIRWTVSGKSTTSYDCPSGGVGFDTYRGSGTASGTVRVSWSAGAYSITAASPQQATFRSTSNCTSPSPSPPASAPLGPATRTSPAPRDDQTQLSAADQGSRNDSWTVSYALSRTTITQSPSPSPRPSPRPSALPPPTTGPHQPSPPPPAIVTPTRSPTVTSTPRRSHSPRPSARPSRSPSASPTAVVAEPPPPAQPPPPASVKQPRLEVSAFAASLPGPSELHLTLRSAVLDAGLTLLLLLMLLFPAELFNGTLMENYDEVCGWFGPLGRLRERVDASRMVTSRGARWVGALGFTAITAAVYGLVEPDFALDAKSLRLVAALAFGLMALTLLANGAALLFVRLRYGVEGRLRLRPGTLVLALICVLLSRLLHVSPGYVYGIVAGFEFSRELNHAQEGQAVAAWAGWLFAISLGAWVLIEPARHFAESHEASFLPLVAEEVSAALTVEGLTVLLLALAPIRFLHGERLLRWNRLVWAGVYGVVAFTFFALEIRPEWSGAEATVPLRTWLNLFIVFAGISVLFWGYFRFRPARPTELPEAPAHRPDSP